ncbi:MAG: NAD-dependent epimerase/dehydratase family protein [Planctomycetota bacterium]|jgi:farnesol dehydrogenase
METARKVFVTGGTGFIGTRLVEALIDRGHAVRVLSRRADLRPLPGFDPLEAAPWRHERVELVRGNIGDPVSLVRGMEGCSRVFHLAAYAKNWAPETQTFCEVNVQGMRHVLDAAGELGVERVVWTSTAVTFGPTPPGAVGDEEMPRSTDHFYTEYERTKTIAEGEALRRAREGFPVVIVNPTRVYGPGHLTEGNALSTLIDEYDRGKVPVLLNRGVNVGNYVLVDDVVEGHLLAMEKGRVGQRYILGGENVSLKEFFRTVDRVSGKRHWQLPIYKMLPLLFAQLQKWRAEWFNVYPRITPGWVKTFLVDWAYSCEKARRELGYRPTPLLEGIRITYDWLQRVREESS